MKDDVIRQSTCSGEWMQGDKYYDPVEDRTLLPGDGCTFDDWCKETDGAKFGMHPQGFPVFVNANELDVREEYRGGDPYGVLEVGGEPSAFHERRFVCTVEILEDVFAGKQGKLRILDLGCGSGHITAEIRDRFPSAEVSGVDCSLLAIMDANRQYPGIEFAVADAYTLPYAPEYFDAVVCNNIWEHVPDPMRLLASIRRILIPEGIVVISTPSRYRLGNLIRVMIGKPVKFISRHHVTEYSVGQVVEQLRFGGFDANVIDRPLLERSRSISYFVLRRLMAPLLRCYLGIVGSHHSLEWTVFYLAKKKSNE